MNVLSGRVFHFGQGRDDPISSLNIALRSTQPKRGSLVVLPEAFNFGRLYSEAGGPRVGKDQLIEDLQNKGRSSDLSFVVGILEPMAGETFVYNSAYFIDGSGAYLMCRKMSDD